MIWDVISLEVCLALVGGTIWGVLLGVMPGITGLMALTMALPVAVHLQPISGLAMLVAIHAVADTGGAVTAIALGIPGTPSNIATVEDGHELTRLGHMRRAISASAFASAFGGVIGFLLLVLTLPAALTFVKLAGAPEVFAICCLGLLSVAKLGSSSLQQGLLVAAFGVFLGLSGMKQATGEPRLWFGITPMLDGFNILALTTGLFGGPELVRLIISSEAFLPKQSLERSPVVQGMRDVLARPGILLKSSLIGWFVGIMPGVGGTVSSLLAYAWSGAGAGPRTVVKRLDGVIAAEASNNAKEGGDLVPTLTLGLPGGAGMSILIGAFVMYGLTPGPQLMTNHPEILVSIAFALLVSNLLGGVLVAFGSRALLYLLKLPSAILAPLAVTLAVVGVLSVRGELFDLWTAFLFCGLGVVMIRHGYSRPALIMGFVLAPAIETYGNIALNAYGWQFLIRPGVILVIAAAVLLIAVLGKELIRMRVKR